MSEEKINISELENNLENNLQEPFDEENESIEEATLADPHFEELWMRATADLENARKRFEKEKEEIAQFSVIRFAKDLLAVADNLDRALETIGESCQETMNSLVEGIRLTQRELEKVFTKFGIEKIDSLNQVFDPNWHQAVCECESSQEIPPGTVVAILQQGYRIYGRLLRPALVTVSK